MSEDGLRDELAQAITASLKDGLWRLTTPRDCADAVLPIVQVHIDAAREQVAEQIAQAIDENAARVLGTYADGLYRAARIAREHALDGTP